SFQASSRDTYLVKYILDILFLAGGAYFTVYILKNVVSDFNLGRLIDYVIYATVLQSLISFYLFFNPSEFANLMSLLNPNTNKGVLVRMEAVEFRLMGLANAFITAVYKYGVALILLSIL